MRDAKYAKERIAKNRLNYQIIGKLGSALYFFMITLKSFNPMYEFSLVNYLKVFTDAMKKAEKPQPKNTPLRIENILESFKRLIF